MKKKIMVGIALSVMLVFLSSCSASEKKTVAPTEPPTKKPSPTPTDVLPTPTTEPAATEDNLVTISLNNDTGDMICAIFGYTSEESGELPNLIEGQVMMNGQQIDIDLEKGTYNFQVWDCQMNSLVNLYEFKIEEDFAWNLSGEPEGYVYEGQQSVILINERAWDICEFYIRSTGSEDWGDNLFAPAYDYYLAAGSTLIEPIVPGTFDFKLVYCDGTLASLKEAIEIPEDQNMTWTLTP
jgi:hypothetical protein